MTVLSVANPKSIQDASRTRIGQAMVIAFRRTALPFAVSARMAWVQLTHRLEFADAKSFKRTRRHATKLASKKATQSRWISLRIP